MKMMETGFLALLMLVLLRSWPGVAGISEVSALAAFKAALNDPTSVLQSWDTTLVTPCTWIHIICNPENRVTRIDLGNANLSGPLVPDLGQLHNLQYLELYNNSLSGRIPDELGNLAKLLTLDLYSNNLTGPIPNSLGNLTSLVYLRLNDNGLNGSIPMSLTNVSALQVLDLSKNNLSGTIPLNGSFAKFTNLSFAGNENLLYAPAPPPLPPPPPTTPPPPSAGRRTIIIAGLVAADAALLFSALAFALLSYLGRQRRLIHFFHIPGEEEPEAHLGQPKNFSLRELQIATDHFSPKNNLGP